MMGWSLISHDMGTGNPCSRCDRERLVCPPVAPKKNMEGEKALTFDETIFIV